MSAIMPVWNGAAYLRDSVESLLRQTRPPHEVIVVDDGSTDETPSILESYGDAIRVVRKQNGGQCSALCAGIAVAQGDVLAFNDHDDLWLPLKCELQCAALEADSTRDAVFGFCEQFVSPELDEEFKRRYAPPRPILRGETVACIAVRRSSYERLGAFDCDHGATYFFDWLGRAKAGGMRSLMLEDVIARRRLHPNNLGRQQAPVRDQQLLRTLRQKIAGAPARKSPP